MAQANLFPAFESPEQAEGLHVKGPDCVCNPFYRTPEDGVTRVHHRPLTETNQTPEKRPTWLPVDGDPEWETNAGKYQLEVSDQVFRSEVDVLDSRVIE